MASTGEICVMTGAFGEPSLGPPPGWSVLEGDPQARAWRGYASDDKKVSAGTWSSTVGSYRVEYASSEFCHVTKGSCSITSDTGVTVNISEGQSFLVPVGFCGTWTVIEDMEKSYIFFSVA